MSSPVPYSTKYCTNLEHTRHGGFQTLDEEDRQPTPSGSTTWHYDGDRRSRRKMKTETDEDGDRQRRRQMKMETVEDEDRLTLGTSELAAPLQLTTHLSEHRT